MTKPIAVPLAVREGVERYCRQHVGEEKPPVASELVVALGWGGDHYYFWRCGMYHGVELDGTVHT